VPVSMCVKVCVRNYVYAHDRLPAVVEEKGKRMGWRVVFLMLK